MFKHFVSSFCVIIFHKIVSGKKGDLNEILTIKLK
jgi:hypothetical protein